MKKFFTFIGLCLVLGLQAAKNPNRPLAAPNRPLSSFGYCMRDVSDFLMWEEYGFHAISEANQIYINDIIHELGMDDYCIEMRGMSNAAQFAVGRINAFVVPSLFTNKKSHAFLFISYDRKPQGFKPGDECHQMRERSKNVNFCEVRLVLSY